LRKIKRKDKIFIAGVVIGVGVLLYVTRQKSPRIAEQIDTNSLDTGSTGFTKVIESVVKFLVPTVPKQTGDYQTDFRNNAKAYVNTLGVPVVVP
jgi:hypothetical protein